jgi:hypothetical protein
MAININIPSEVTQNITEGVTSTAPSEDAVFNALADKANSADLATVATTGDYNDLINQPSIPAAQVNSDWNATSGVAEILNKPTIPDVSGFVPYTGANADLDMGSYNVTADHMALNVSPSGSGYVVGATQWNNTIGSSETLLKGGNVSLKNGVDLVARIVNKVTPNTTLTKAAYQAVRVSGAQGGRLAVALAKADTDNNSADTIGLVTETINTNQEGFIITVGQLLNVNTTGSLQGETWADGDVLYLSPTTAGKLTNIKPTGATGHIVVIGYVEYAHANNGAIYVKIMNGWELDELHNVYINPSTLADNNLLQYDSATSLWKNESLSTAGVQPTLQSGTNIKTINGTTLLGSGDITVGGGITVGTTAVTSGTDTRVFFQQGGVMQQDSNFTFNNTQKRLTLKAVGTAATDIPFSIRNSADTANIIETRGNASIVFANGVSTYSLNPRTDADGFTLNSGNGLYGTGTGMEVVSSQFLINNSSTRTFRFTGSSVTNLWEFRNESGQLRICPTTDTTNPIINLNGTTRFVGVGILTPAARLDVKAQGALSTDIAFRVRNSADSANILSVNGDGTQTWIPPANNALSTIKNGANNFIQWSNENFGNIAIGLSTSNLFTPTDYYNTLIGFGNVVSSGTSGVVRVGGSGSTNGAFAINIGYGGKASGTNSIKIGYGTGTSSFGGTNSIHIGTTTSGNDITPDNVFMTYFNSQSSSTLTRSNGSFGLLGQGAYIIANGTGANGLTTFMGDGGNTLVVRNHASIPSTNVVDSFQQYSADIVAGNAAPHFRTENGNIIKLYQQSSSGITTVAQLVTVLQNLGLLS